MNLITPERRLAAVAEVREALGIPAPLAVGLLIWARRDRAFASTASVAEAYDRWTDDQLLERLWGDHVHLGHYGDPPRRRDFRQAKVEFVHELVRWSGLDQLPPGSRVLDVGCGIGGSARILARDYGFDVLGISISPGQIERARQLTPAGLPCRFAVMDALALELADGSFDAVICNRLFHHFFESSVRVAALRELRRISRGPIVMSFFCSQSVSSAAFLLRNRLRREPATDRVPISFNTISADIAAAGTCIRASPPQTLNTCVIDAQPD